MQSSFLRREPLRKTLWCNISFNYLKYSLEMTESLVLVRLTCSSLFTQPLMTWKQRSFTRLSSVLNVSVVSRKRLFLSWCRSSICSSSASSFLWSTRGQRDGETVTERPGSEPGRRLFGLSRRASAWPTWCTISDWTCRFRTCMRAVVTTERTSGTTISLRMSLMSRWFLWKRAAAECFTEKPSS